MRSLLGFVLITALIYQAISYDKCPFDWLSEDKGAKCCKDIILAKHNTLRRKLVEGKIPDEPRAKKIRPLVWSNVLAKAAQGVANTCTFEHREVNDTGFESIGQNLFHECRYEMRASVNWEQALTYWFNEHEDYMYPSQENYEFTGHYTQMISDYSRYIGCASTFYEKGGKKEMFCKLYVCHYAPAGNIGGVPPYEAIEEEEE